MFHSVICIIMKLLYFNKVFIVPVKEVCKSVIQNFCFIVYFLKKKKTLVK